MNELLFDYSIPGFPILTLIIKLLLFLLFPIIFVAITLFLVKIVGFFMNIFFPVIEAHEFTVNSDTITFNKVDGKTDSYLLSDTHSLTLSYSYKGVFIHTVKTKQAYSLKISSEIIESKLDTIPNFHKQVTFVESRKGKIRTVWYGNPLFEAENKSFTVTNKNLNKDNEARY